MGIKDFSKTFSSIILKDLTKYKNKTLAIDAMTELWRAALGAKNINLLTDKNGNPTLHISVILSNIIDFQKKKINTIWIFDYDKKSSDNFDFHNPDKLPEIIKRRKKKEEAKKEILLLNEKKSAFVTKIEDFSDSDNDMDEKIDKEIKKQEKRAFTVNTSMINDIKMILNCFNIKWIEAPMGYEGEQIASFLSYDNKVDAVYSGDTDTIPFGAKILLRKNPRNKKIYEYKQNDILEEIKKNNEEIKNPTLLDIQTICSILGSDFSKRTKRVGPKTVIKKYNNINLQEDQKNAIKIFNKKINKNDIIINNKNKKTFINCEINNLIDWLVIEKSFKKTRIIKWIEKIMKKDKNGLWILN